MEMLFAHEVSLYCSCSIQELLKGGIAFLNQKLDIHIEAIEKGKSRFLLEEINKFRRKAIKYICNPGK